jgi:hypothetical protein
MHTGILKHYGVLITYRDGSKFSRDFRTETETLRWLDENVILTETLQVSLYPVWSKPGESVALEVQHFPPAGD